MIVVCNDNGCYGGVNDHGIGAVGTFVNIADNQNNYFDKDNLAIILSMGGGEMVVDYLRHNSMKLYGNMLISVKEKIYAFELAGDLIDCQEVTAYVMTNHFQRLPLQIQTINDTLICNWTTKRLKRAKELIGSVVSIDDAKCFLSDHESEIDYQICNHGQIRTASSYIIDGRNKCIHYCHGNPCINEYIIHAL